MGRDYESYTSCDGGIEGECSRMVRDTQAQDAYFWPCRRKTEREDGLCAPHAAAATRADRR